MRQTTSLRRRGFSKWNSKFLSLFFSFGVVVKSRHELQLLDREVVETFTYKIVSLSREVEPRYDTHLCPLRVFGSSVTVRNGPCTVDWKYILFRDFCSQNFFFQNKIFVLPTKTNFLGISPRERWGITFIYYLYVNTNSVPHVELKWPFNREYFWRVGVERGVIIWWWTFDVNSSMVKYPESSNTHYG